MNKLQRNQVIATIVTPLIILTIIFGVIGLCLMDKGYSIPFFVAFAYILLGIFFLFVFGGGIAVLIVIGRLIIQCAAQWRLSYRLKGLCPPEDWEEMKYFIFDDGFECRTLCYNENDEEDKKYIQEQKELCKKYSQFAVDALADNSFLSRVWLNWK